MISVTSIVAKSIVAKCGFEQPTISKSKRTRAWRTIFSNNVVTCAVNESFAEVEQTFHQEALEVLQRRREKSQDYVEK